MRGEAFRAVQARLQPFQASGTLWSISDALAPLVANTGYHALAQPSGTRLDTSGSARALNTAILALRESNRTEPWFWAPYIHICP